MKTMFGVALAVVLLASASPFKQGGGPDVVEQLRVTLFSGEFPPTDLRAVH